MHNQKCGVQPLSLRGGGWLALVVGLTLSFGAATAETVALDWRGGSYRVPAVINGATSVNFILDTGATDVSLPEEVAQELMRAGTLSSGDFRGTKVYVLADGSRVRSKSVVLREVRVGGQAVQNVSASIAPARSPPLLGQSFLAKFPAWTLDNQKHVLVLGSPSETGSAAADNPRTQAGYGAFAIDESAGKFGLSTNEATPRDAEEAAIKGCSAADCKIVFRVGPRQCGAIALTEDGKIWGGATRPARADAALAALQNCQKRTTAQCTVHGAECNRPG